MTKKELAEIARIINTQANCEHRNLTQISGLGFNYGIGVICAECGKEMLNEEIKLYKKLFGEDGYGDGIKDSDLSFLHERHEISEKFINALVENKHDLKKVELEKVISNKSKRKYMPRIIKILIGLVLVKFLWDLSTIVPSVINHFLN